MEQPKTDSDLVKIQHEMCLHMVEKALTNNYMIGKLVGEIESLGCGITESFFRCMREPGTIQRNTGGFTLPSGGDEKYVPSIIIYENNIFTQAQLERTLQHELIHAYDKCKGKLDHKNCLHHACTEVRASNLSGECSWFQEMLRGHFTYVGGKMECVKRRAALSVEANPYCRGKSKLAVEKVFDDAYHDISPLNENDIWQSK